MTGAEIRKIHEAAIRKAADDYNHAMAPIRQALGEATAPLEKAFEDAREPVMKIYDEACRAADRARKEALEALPPEEPRHCSSCQCGRD